MKNILLSCMYCAAICLSNFDCFAAEIKSEYQNEAKKNVEVFTTTLENGLQVIYFPTDSNGLIYFGVLYNVGSADDPLDKIGLSHFLEHMMFKGTHSLPGDKLKYFLDKYDAYSNAFTGHDLTFYIHAVKSEFLDLDLQIEADRMKGLSFDNKHLMKEKEVVAEERKLRYESNPLTRYLSDAVPHSIFMYSPYGLPVGGYPWHIHKYDKESLIEHYREFYNPNNATIIIVGNTSDTPQNTYEKLLKRITELFGKIENNSVFPPARLRPFDPTDSGIKQVIDRSIPEVKTSELSMIYSISRDLISTTKEKLTLQLLLKILFGPSVMKKILVDEKQLVYNVKAAYEKIKFSEKHLIEIELALKNDVSRKIVEEELFKVIRTFKDEILSEDLFEKNKRHMLNSYDLQFDDPNNILLSIVDDLVHDVTIDEIKTKRAIIESISLEDVKNVFDKVMKDEFITHKIYSHPTDVEPEGIIKY